VTALTRSYQERQRAAFQQKPSSWVREILTDGFDSGPKSTLFPGVRLGQYVLTSAIGESKNNQGNSDTQQDPCDICGCGDVLHERIQPRRFHSFIEERIFTRLRHSEKPHAVQCLGVCRRLQFVSMCQRRPEETAGIHSAPCKTSVHACIRGL